MRPIRAGETREEWFLARDIWNKRPWWYKLVVLTKRKIVDFIDQLLAFGVISFLWIFVLGVPLGCMFIGFGQYDSWYAKHYPSPTPYPTPAITPSLVMGGSYICEGGDWFYITEGYIVGYAEHEMSSEVLITFIEGSKLLYDDRWYDYDGDTGFWNRLDKDGYPELAHLQGDIWFQSGLPNVGWSNNTCNQ